MTDGTLQDPRVATLALLDRLIRQGRALYEGCTRNTQSTQSQILSASSACDVDMRIWQRDCAEAVNELSGGSKAHWLSRAYSGALLVRSSGGDAVVEAAPAQIVERILEVLERARASIAGANTAAPLEAPQPHRFDFVHDEALRPVLEQAFADSARTLDGGDYDTSLKTSCGILEARLTDALDHADQDGARGFSRVAAADASFADRIKTAEQLGLIRGGCARLTPAARGYRDDPPPPITERDARIARQVLAVVMRDLDPGR
jgi:hypothetical protein